MPTLSFLETDPGLFKSFSWPYRELSFNDAMTWRRLLPRSVLPTYYDQWTVTSPPAEAAQLINEARMFGKFARVEIWQTADARLANALVTLPTLAVGVVEDGFGGMHYWPIASWGDGPLTLQQIRTHQRRNWFLAAMLAFMVAVVAEFILATLVHHIGWGWTFASVVGVGCVGYIALCNLMDMMQEPL